MTNATVAGDSNAIVQNQGDGNTITVMMGAGPLTLIRHHRPSPKPQRVLEVINAFSTPLPLLGREAELAEFQSWLSSDQKIAVRCLTGEAGSGKSRFAIELCAQAERQGWQAGFVSGRELDRFWSQRSLAAWSWAKPTLIVVDYAAAKSRMLKEWLEELAQNSQGGTAALRLLLLERVAEVDGGWWGEVATTTSAGADQDLRRMVGDAKPVSLAPLADPNARRAILTQVMAAVRPLVEGSTGGAFPPPGNNSTLDQRIATALPLELAMMAVWAVHEGSAAALPATQADLAFAMAGYETRRFERKAGGRGQTFLNHLLHMAALATVQAPLSGDELEQRIATEAQAESWSGDHDGLEDALHDLMPGEGKGGTAPLQPDLIGEAFVLRVLPGRKPGKETAALLRWHMVRPREVEENLIRLLQDFGGHKDGQHAQEWLRRIIAEEEDGDALAALADRLPENTVNLRDLAALASARLVNLLRSHMENTGQTAKSLHTLAVGLNNLGNRLSDLGRWEQALAAALEAVDIRRALAARQPDAFLPNLASSLNNLGNHLSNLGRPEEALAAAQEAVDIYQDLATRQPDAFLPDLAGTLNNVGGHFSTLGRREEALAAAQKAVEVYRALAARQPDAFRPDLAMALNNLGGRFSALGRPEKALAAAQEAVDIRRALAARQPDAFLPDLAGSLNNLGNGLSGLGRRGEALAAAQEAVKIRRALAARQPDVFRPDLAMALNNLGTRLSDVGRREEALTAAQEAVDIRRALAARQPDAFRPSLASALNNLGNHLSGLGQREQALATAQEAVEVYRDLAARQPDAFLPDLAISLNNLGNRLSELGRRDQALATAQEAVEFSRNLVAQQPDAFLPDLARALNNLGGRFSALGQREEALAATQEAVNIRRSLAARQPEAFLPDLASALNNLGNGLADLGRPEPALAAAQETVDIRRVLAARQPDAFLPALASSLYSLSGRLSSLGRQEEALAAAQEAMNIYRDLAEQRPAAFLPSWARAAMRLSFCVEDANQALALNTEALTQLLPAAETQPHALGRFLHAIAGDYYQRCQSLDAPPDEDLLARVVGVLEAAHLLDDETTP